MTHNSSHMTERNSATRLAIASQLRDGAPGIWSCRGGGLSTSTTSSSSFGKMGRSCFVALLTWGHFFPS